MTHLSAITPARPRHLSSGTGSGGPAQDARLRVLLALMETSGLQAPRAPQAHSPAAISWASETHQSYAWIGTSPGLDLEARLLFRPGVAGLLEREIGEPGYAPRPLLLGAGTDPYQPVERTLGMTREVLEVLDRAGHPVTIVTKSTGVLRDLDILTRLAARNLVQVCFSVATLDNRLARLVEPRAATPLRRLAAMHELSRAGIPVGVIAGPMIPGVNDAEIEKVMEAAHAHGARSAGYVLLRLQPEIRRAFENWLNAQMPDRAARVLALIREARAGLARDARPVGLDASGDILARRFVAAARRLGLDGARRNLSAEITLPAVTERQPALL